jgi:hypothetical protein
MPRSHNEIRKQQTLREMARLTSQLSLLEYELDILERQARNYGATEEEIQEVKTV